MYIIEHIVVPNLCILCSVLTLQLKKCVKLSISCFNLGFKNKNFLILTPSQ